MKRRLLAALAVVLALVAALGTAFVLVVLQPRYDEEMGLGLANSQRAQAALDRGDQQEARLSTMSAESSFDGAREIGTGITITWIVVGVALVGAVAIVVGLRSGRRAPAAATPPAPSGVGWSADATTAMTPRPAQRPDPSETPAPRPPRSQGPPPGWYTDPHGDQRWFDGRQWTARVR